MPVEQFELTSRTPFAGGRLYGGCRFERFDGIVRYAVDPEHPANAAIADLMLAPRDSDGLVRFSGDATVIAPDSGNGGILLDVPNRGRRVAPRMFHAADLQDDHEILPGRPLLFERGFGMAFCGWQWDVPRDNGRMGLAAPRLNDFDGEMQLRFQISYRAPHIALTDQHVGEVGNHMPIPPEPQLAPHARLLVRQTQYGAATEIARGAWAFAVAGPDGTAVPSSTHVWLEGGFEPGLIYDLVYTPQACPVVGTGMLALRDFATFLKSGDAPINKCTHVVGEGVSQCGRLLRTLLYHGLNHSEAGTRAFDGLLIHVAGGRRGEFNHRFGQPSVQPTPGFGHLAPHADTATSSCVEGLLDRLTEANMLPKIFYTDTSAEYWRGDASLAHIDAASNEDLTLPGDVRRYLLSSTQHGVGVLPLMDEAFSNRGANLFNVIDYRPLLRSLLMNLFDWVMHDRVPRPSEVPQLGDGTAVTRDVALARLATSGGLTLPRASELNHIWPLDLGERAASGTGRFPAEVAGAPFEPLVSALDSDGNELAGLPMPDVRVPVGTHTGFNPRHPETGGTGQLLQYMGSTRLFERATLAARYGDRTGYLALVEGAAGEAAASGQLLEQDVAWCIELAASRFDVAWGDG